MGSYRCVKCGHGRKLEAWANAIAHGPVHADGCLAHYDVVEDFGMICEDSIRCAEHGDTVGIEKYVGGQWCRWEPCAGCDGHGRREEYLRWGKERVTCRDCDGTGGTWEPINVAVVAHAR